MKITPQLEKYQKADMKICKKFSRRLKELKKDRGMTLDEIADILGISRQSVVYYAMGDRLPSIPILIRIVKLFGTSVDYILGVSDDRWS